jgi:hypothetical protein
LTYHSAKLLSSAQQKALNKELFAVKTIGEWPMPRVAHDKDFAECIWGFGTRQRR